MEKNKLLASNEEHKELIDVKRKKHKLEKE